MSAAPKSFRRYTLVEYIEQVLRPIVGRVRFSEIHVHGTWKPTIADFRKRPGEYYMQAMYRAHLARGFFDIAQHATVDPDGYIWDGRSLLLPPASATGNNDPDADGVHPFMFEMIGNFDRGCERLEGPQLLTTSGLCSAIMKLWNLGQDAIHFHREYTNQKTCPGSGIEKTWFLDQVTKPKMSNQEPTAPAEDDVSAWAREARDWAVAMGITDGDRPRDPLTREEAWTMLYRMKKEK
ncbi:peptidoglycan recognition protein family protein [Paenibacillus alkalitolerans]|uniref:peptidoglycan recognition protein family protein n=1 Tax=Paenibacillus alkalitolerans TaxID=2799335 RepID=UPI0018F51D87|nr:peptidoglycan recognition family protein [Paenibacillus alkalitolerans]